MAIRDKPSTISRMNKLDETIVAQRKQLLDFIDLQKQLTTKLRETSEAILQLRGSLAALDYVKSLESVDNNDVA